ncbi:hypothetical protein AURANDRAFT_72688 [Aureococcus anophagefferens]|uniref:Uncharacterized protein n=1 Tax=Aureococcus anophagefferens TaxID=44056 RepID=F0YMK9_AURAN|nr:hypothetical protein AURANDRAFT_72688 [Aureococcus anophagefferens]EGB03661.1 hypothetical protein AURANDRAFT_72688 [Aureococcus anophagefferens]|eukprot:XP_009041663.1 hypothetical protein AURANDRAFT_72688 [Aureococcus anophagefferens]
MYGAQSYILQHSKICLHSVVQTLDHNCRACRLADSFWWFQICVIEPRDRGVDLNELNKSIDPNQRVQRQHKDFVLGRFYEAMAYSVLLILAAAYPRRRDHFLEDQPLKLHIIKTCAEWTIGIQPRDLNESHWIVKGESNGDRKHGVLPKAKTLFVSSRRSVVDRKIKRAIRAAPKPMPVEYLLSNSGVLRRNAMDEYARQRQDATKAISFFNRERYSFS